MPKFHAPISTAVAIAFGLLVLISFALPGLEGLRGSILGWAVLLAAVALLLGLANLFRVHFYKIRNKDKALYSFVLLAAMLAAFTITLLQGRQGLIAEWLFNYIQVPLESSLMALLSITLTVAAARLLQQRNDFTSILFILTVFIVLLGTAPLFGLEFPFFSQVLTPYVSRVLSEGGARGLLIGVGLGTLATGLRILIGADRPFGG